MASRLSILQWTKGGVVLVGKDNEIDAPPMPACGVRNFASHPCHRFQHYTVGRFSMGNLISCQYKYQDTPVNPITRKR